MEQPRKPVGTKDISDLKARLGLVKPAPATTPAAGMSAAPPPPLGAQAAAAHRPARTAADEAAMSAYPETPPPAAAPMRQPPVASARAPVAAPQHDPFAAMRPRDGRGFDLGPVQDGGPVENVRSRGGPILVLGMLALGAVGGLVGWGFGVAAVGRANYNSANVAAKKIKGELDEMHKTLTQVGQAAAMSQQRMNGAHLDTLSYDPKLIDDLEQIKLDPRPDTSKIFRTDYYRLEELTVDRLMNYYYDTIALYGEVERHIKRTKADKPSLEAQVAKTADEKAGKNYGVIFDTRGKLTVATLVEVGKPVCKGGGNECAADQIEGFQIRANTGANWSNRKVAPKPEMNTLVPIDVSQPLVQSVMSGSPDQVRMEQYKQRYNNIRLILARLTATQKDLAEQVGKAAGRQNMFSIFAVTPPR